MSDKISPFLLKRLFSLAGLLPLGGFLIQHLFGNSFVFVSPEAFNEHSEFLTSLPMVYLIEGLFIYLPLFFHAGLGFVIIYQGENNFIDYGYHRNWMYFMQRFTGVLALIFIVTHSYTTRISSVIAGTEYHYADMAQTLQNPYWFSFYLTGVLSVCLHFTNGIWSFCVTWGIATGRQAQRSIAAAGWVLFVVLGGWCVAILTEFLK
jgi:succinate dehydrogenase / fumarate reductase, cytochrome b subunit